LFDPAKRAIDVVVSITTMVLAAPLLCLVAFAVLLDSGRPVVFRHRRVGRFGEPFAMYKFRTMEVDSESFGFRTEPGDRRITRIGKRLRSSSLDELPQLLNVLLGDMSLVGPRPDVTEQLEEYKAADLQRRLSVRPGMTGLAQAELRSKATPAERLALDLHYVDHRSLRLDLAVVRATLAGLATGG